MNDFQGDERGEKSTPELSAKYNGIAHVLRSSNFFKVVPLDGPSEGATRAAHSRSWARLEGEKVVLLAIRPDVPGSIQSSHPLRGLVRSTVPAVVASQTDDDIEHTNRLAVASYGRGEISIHRTAGLTASVLTHHFGGAVTRSRVAIKNDQLTLSITQDLVEWIEIHVSS
jgi:hypothetical protein